IVLLDQFVWQPLLAWAERFKFSQVENDNQATSWFLNSLRRSALAQAVYQRVFVGLNRWLDKTLNRPPQTVAGLETVETGRRSVLGWIFLLLAGLAIGYGVVQAVGLLLTLPLSAWGDIAVGALATLLRV